MSTVGLAEAGTKMAAPLSADQQVRGQGNSNAWKHVRMETCPHGNMSAWKHVRMERVVRKGLVMSAIQKNTIFLNYC